MNATEFLVNGTLGTAVLTLDNNNILQKCDFLSHDLDDSEKKSRFAGREVKVILDRTSEECKIVGPNSYFLLPRAVDYHIRLKGAVDVVQCVINTPSPRPLPVINDITKTELDKKSKTKMPNIEVEGDSDYLNKKFEAKLPDREPMIKVIKNHVADQYISCSIALNLNENIKVLNSITKFYDDSGLTNSCVTEPNLADSPETRNHKLETSLEEPLKTLYTALNNEYLNCTDAEKLATAKDKLLKEFTDKIYDIASKNIDIDKDYLSKHNEKFTLINNIISTSFKAITTDIEENFSKLPSDVDINMEKLIQCQITEIVGQIGDHTRYARAINVMQYRPFSDSFIGMKFIAEAEGYMTAYKSVSNALGFKLTPITTIKDEDMMYILNSNTKVFGVRSEISGFIIEVKKATKEEINKIREDAEKHLKDKGYQVKVRIQNIIGVVTFIE